MCTHTQKKLALQTVLEAKREKFMDDALIYAKSLCEELEISFEPLRRIRRKHIFGDGGKDVRLSYEDDLSDVEHGRLDQAPQDINKEELQLEGVLLQTFEAATDPDLSTCKLYAVNNMVVCDYSWRTVWWHFLRVDDVPPHAGVGLMCFGGEGFLTPNSKVEGRKKSLLF
ncbi:uncharacterized protein TNCV_1904101 [Trichonephila clavipes]|nr:uncharacterized protein TNCV_1904101 [Trichonephila clavipes]